MKKPIILAVDDDSQVLRAIARDLRNQYQENYRVLSTISPQEALDTVVELKKKEETIAIFLSDQRMPEMLGVEMLEQAKEYYPEAKRLLLTAYSDIDAAIKAINNVQLDYYLLKPWDPPEERLFPVMDDLLEEWAVGYRPKFKGIRLVGYQYSPKSHRIKDYLTGNLVPYQWLDIERNNKAGELLELNDLDAKDLPVIFFQDGSYLENPDLLPIAEKLGMQPHASEEVYDVAIIGAGPAGLAAAVYGASEGLNTLLIERRAPGGQAGTSSRIENYLGFPKGLSGSDLARRAITQATRFGTEFLSPREATGIRSNDQYKTIELANGQEINALSVVITTGVNYRKLDTKGVSDFTGAGIYYGSAMTEVQSCKNEQVYIVGGGNSAGQAAVYLAGFAEKVSIAIRGASPTKSMSQYLIDQIEDIDNIDVLPNTEVTNAFGDGRLQELELTNSESGRPQKVKAAALFIFIGARPYTGWIGLDILKNDRGFIETGRDLQGYDEFKKIWKLERSPFLLESSSPGIFAAGDVRAGAMNRVASAVGEGAMSIKFVHEYLSADGG